MQSGRSAGPLQAAAGARAPCLPELIAPSLWQSWPRPGDPAARSTPLACHTSSVNRPAARWGSGRRSGGPKFSGRVPAPRQRRVTADHPAVAMAKPLRNAGGKSERGAEEGYTRKAVTFALFCFVVAEPSLALANGVPSVAPGWLLREPARVSAGCRERAGPGLVLAHVIT